MILEEIRLPKPKYAGTASLEEVVLKRRSRRNYVEKAVSLEVLSQVLWAAQGVTDPMSGKRAAPSAGMTYPLVTYVVVGDAEKLSPGLYRYDVKQHSLTKVLNGDLRAALAHAALDQEFIEDAAFSIVLSAIYERTTRRYGERGVRYVHMEIGHVGQNVYLQAEALRLGTVVVGAFHDDEVRRVLKLPKNENPLYIIPVGSLR